MLGISKRTRSRSENCVTVLRRQKTAPSTDGILWFFLETPDIYGTFACQVISVNIQVALGAQCICSLQIQLMLEYYKWILLSKKCIQYMIKKPYISQMIGQTTALRKIFDCTKVANDFIATDYSRIKSHRSKGSQPFLRQYGFSTYIAIIFLLN